MPRMGRPKMQANKRRKHQLAIRLTDTELKALKNVCEETGMTESEVIRRCIEDGLQGVEIYARRERRKKS